MQSFNIFSCKLRFLWHNNNCFFIQPQQGTYVFTSKSRVSIHFEQTSPSNLPNLQEGNAEIYSDGAAELFDTVFIYNAKKHKRLTTTTCPKHDLPWIDIRQAWPSTASFNFI